MNFFRLAKQKSGEQPFDGERSNGKESTPHRKALLTAKNLSLCSTSDARSLVSFEIAQKLEALPLGVLYHSGRKILLVAGVKERASETISSLRFLTEHEIKVEEAPSLALTTAILLAYKKDGKSLEIAHKKLKAAEETECAENGGVSPDYLSHFHPRSGEAAAFLASLIEYVYSIGASDLHLIPRHDGAVARARINGELYSRNGNICSRQTYVQIVQRIKVLCNLPVSRIGVPQDGSFILPVGSKRSSVRVSLMPTLHGEKAVLRFFSDEGIVPLPSLGFRDRELQFLFNFAKEREGLFISAGATGSGKTTTMYSLMKHLASKNLSLASVEDPIEIELPEVAQTSINPEKGIQYSDCLRSLLRQDPDAVMIGEIRDSSSAQTAFDAALTGHLIVTTVHARSVYDALIRLQELRVPRLSISQGLKLIVVQELHPKLCGRCKVINAEVSVTNGFDTYRGVGCAACDYSGYSGKIVATELLALNERVSAVLSEGIPNRERFFELCTSENYISMIESRNSLLREGFIDEGEIRCLNFSIDQTFVCS